MDGMDDRRSPPQDPLRNRRALEGDWAAGLPGPAHAHGLPAPEPIGLPPETEAAPEPAAARRTGRGAGGRAGGAAPPPAPARAPPPPPPRAPAGGTRGGGGGEERRGGVFCWG